MLGFHPEELVRFGADLRSVAPTGGARMFPVITLKQSTQRHRAYHTMSSVVTNPREENIQQEEEELLLLTV